MSSSSSPGSLLSEHRGRGRDTCTASRRRTRVKSRCRPEGAGSGKRIPSPRAAHVGRCGRETRPLRLRPPGFRGGRGRLGICTAGPCSTLSSESIGIIATAPGWWMTSLVIWRPSGIRSVSTRASTILPENTVSWLMGCKGSVILVSLEDPTGGRSSPSPQPSPLREREFVDWQSHLTSFAYPLQPQYHFNVFLMYSNQPGFPTPGFPLPVFTRTGFAGTTSEWLSMSYSYGFGTSLTGLRMAG